MSRFTRYARFMGDIVVLLAASSVLTLAVVAMGLILTPGPQDILDRILSRNVHNGTVGEVTRCMQRNAEIGNPEFVEPFCRAKHSVPISGALELQAACIDPGKVTITATNDSDDVVFTGFSLRTGDGEPAALVQGQWLTPGASRDYALEALCVPGQTPDAVVAVARRGVRAGSAAELREYDAMVQSSASPAILSATAATVEAQPGLATALQTALLEPSPRADPAEAGATAIAGHTLAEAPEEALAPAVEAAAVLPPDPPAADNPSASAAAPPPLTAADRSGSKGPNAAHQPAQPSIRLRSSELRIRESDGVALIELSVEPAAVAAGWVQYALIQESATADGDFAAALSGRVPVDSGATGSTILVPIINDALREPEEAFLVRLGQASQNLKLQEGTELRVRIVDDD